MAGPIARLYATLGLDAREFAQGIQGAQGTIGGFGSKVTAGATLAGVAMGDFAAQGIQAYTQLDTKMREVFTLMPDITEQAMVEMTQGARDFAVQFGLSTDEAVQGLYNSLSAGVPPDNVFDFMETAQKAATAGVTDLSSSIGLLTAVTKGYGDTSQEFTQQVSDLAFKTVQLGQTTFPELSASIGKVVPGAAALGIEASDLSAVFATLTGVTGNTAEVATQWKAVQTALIKPTADMARVLEEQGFASGKAAIEALGLQGTLEMLREATGGSDDMLAKMLGSSEALTAAMQLTAGSADKLTDNIGQMQDVTGATDAAFQKMDSGIEASGRKIAAWFNDIKLTVGKELQSFGPLLYAFGPQMGRWIGRGLGAAAGFITSTLLGPAISKAVAIGGAFAGQAYSTAVAVASKLGAALSALWAGMGGGRVMAAARSAGMMAGGVFGTAFKLAAAAGIAAVAVLMAVELGKLREQNIAAAAANDKATASVIASGMSKADAEKALAGLRAMRDGTSEELTDLKTMLIDFGGIGKGNVLGSVFDIAFGENPTANLDRQIAEFETYIASIPDDLAAAVPTDGQSISSAFFKLLGNAVGAVKAMGIEAPDIAGPIEDEFADARRAVLDGFGSIKEALKNEPKLISKEVRLENMAARMEKVMGNLHKAVRAKDPFAIDYWSKAAAKQRVQMERMRGKTISSVNDIKGKFKEAGVDIGQTWKQTERAAGQASRGARRTAIAQFRALVGSVKGLDLASAGTALINSWAAGIRAGREAVASAAAYITNVFSSMFHGSAVPKIGPLKGFDKMGGTMVDAWIGDIRGRRSRVAAAGAELAGAFSPRPRLGMAAMAAAGAGGGGGEVHIHIGTLIADDKGLDELERRMSRRHGIRNRGPMRYQQ